jgi:hypothetical protein
MFMLALVIIIIVDTLFRPHLTIMSSTIYMYRSVHKKNPIKIGKGEKLVWRKKWVCVSTYLVFRGENSVYTHFSGGGEISVYTHFSGGKTEYILIFPWKQMSIGKKWVCNTGTSRGFLSIDYQVYAYLQEIAVFSYFYFKRKVLEKMECLQSL